MATVRIPFNEWLPDQPAVAQSMQDATNVVPIASGYAPFPLAVDYSNAASESLLTVGTGKFSSITELFAGSATKLYKFNSATLNLDDVSKVGGYNCLSWDFEQFGDVLLAANGIDKIQAWTVDTSTAFADLAAAAPVAKYVAVIRDFVVAANLDLGVNPNKVQWSNIADETNWTSGATSQSDYQLIPDGGNITGITGGEFGIIFLERSIVRMSYIGSPFFFQFDTISRNLGCKYGGSVTQYGQTSYFLSADGFYSCDGQSIVPIGNEKVDRYFYDNVDLNKADKITVAIDPIRKLVVWNYPTVSNTRSLLIYNWQLQRWSQAETTVDYIASSASSGYTLEALDAFGTLDTLPTSLDSPLWTGGNFLFAGVSGTKIITFTGANSTANLITSDIEQGFNSIVTLGRAQIDNGSASVAVASRKELDDTITFSTAVATSSEGRASLRSNGRYHRFEVIPSGNWTSAIGIDVDITPQGNR
jgi:hypothetical protein